MADIHGSLDDRFAALATVFAEQLDSGEELGASIAVIKDGETVVDIWGGYANPERTKPWAENTITNAWSITKTMTALSALLLVDRGHLDLYEKVAHYWPEFAANGKADIEVRHLMSHTSGVSAWAQPVTINDLYDLEKSTAMLAAQAPWWEPGTASGYHLLNFGHLVGEVIRRITGQSLGEFFTTEIAKPMDADFHIGLPPSEFDRVSNVVPPPPLPFDLSKIDPKSVAVKSFSGPRIHTKATWTDEWRTAEIGAANGHGNARAVARAQAVVSHGGEFDGVRLLKPETIDLIFDKQSDGTDLVLLAPFRFGMGYALPQPASLPVVKEGKRCFWGGYGGSIVINDLENHMTIAYVMNKMAGGLIGSPRSDAYVTSIYEAVD